jgi:integrase
MKGNLTRRGKNSWRFKFDVSANPRITKLHTLYGTKKQAQEQAAKIVADHAAGGYVDPNQLTFAEFKDKWLRDWAAMHHSNKTYERNEELLRLHVIPKIGDIPLQKLKPIDLQHLYAGHAGASRTRLHLHRLLHRMLGHAVQWNIVQQNVAERVDAPRVQDDEVEILTEAEAQRVLEALRNRSLYPIVFTALGTGMRRGELLALRWKDVDLDGATLRVEQSLEQTKRGGLVFKAPKTRHGRRSISLPASVVAVLREHWKATLERRLLLGQGKISDDALVFATELGDTRSPNAMTKEWRRVVHAAKLKATFHSLRHTHASSLIAAGIDVLVLSRRLGHGSPVITLKVYGHLFKPDDRAAVAIEGLLSGK